MDKKRKFSQTLTDFLDVILNLQNSTYCPYKKPNDKLI